MRIVDRKTFLALPPGTVFAKWAPCHFEDLCILTGVIVGAKGEPIDFRYTSIVDSLGDLEERTFPDPIDRLLALGAGNEVPVDLAEEWRDGLFDTEQRFAVWSRSDVEALIARLKLSLVETEQRA